MRTWLMLGIALACSGAAAAAPKLPPDSVYQLPTQMVDQRGAKLDWRSRAGRPQVVAMFYSSCKFMCPLIIDSVKGVEKQIPAADRQRLGLLLISMDPKRDVPPTLSALAAKRKLDAATWTLATPPAAEVRAIAGLLGVRYRQLADGEFNHTSELILLDQQGRVIARTAKMGGVPDPEFVTAVRKSLRTAANP